MPPSAVPHGNDAEAGPSHEVPRTPAGPSDIRIAGRRCVAAVCHVSTPASNEIRSSTFTPAPSRSTTTAPACGAPGSGRRSRAAGPDRRRRARRRDGSHGWKRSSRGGAPPSAPAPSASVAWTLSWRDLDRHPVERDLSCEWRTSAASSTCTPRARRRGGRTVTARRRTRRPTRARRRGTVTADDDVVEERPLRRLGDDDLCRRGRRREGATLVVDVPRRPEPMTRAANEASRRSVSR